MLIDKGFLQQVIHKEQPHIHRNLGGQFRYSGGQQHCQLRYQQSAGQGSQHCDQGIQAGGFAVAGMAVEYKKIVQKIQKLTQISRRRTPKARIPKRRMQQRQMQKTLILYM